MGTVIGRFAKSAALVIIFVSASACGPGEARAPNPTRPLDERRAIEVIRRAISLEGSRPAPGRDVVLSGLEKTLRIDVGVEGKEFGIAYITEEDATKVGDAIPPRPATDEKLRLARSGETGDVRILLLYQDNYRFDDLIGEEHQQTAISAERVLTRDVQDFLTYAKTQKYK
jgi:hypothetical protein